MRILSVLIFSLMLVNCGESQSWGNGIKADGNITSKTFDLEKFTGVVSTGSGNVNITPGVQKLVATTSQNIMDILELEVKNEILYIGFKESVRDLKELTFDINIPSVHHLGMTGSGKMKVKGFDQQPSLTMKLSGSGSIHADNGANEMEVKLSGSGGLFVNGNASSGEFKVTGSGTIHAKDLKIQNVQASITGSGGIDIACQGSLDANITGSGSIDVYGSPILKSRVTGSGRVREHN